MNNDLIQRYQPGGDIYASLAAEYGKPGADQVASVAWTGDRSKVTEAVTSISHGGPLETSTAAIFSEQIMTDPFGAPLETANKGLGNLSKSLIGGVFSNGWVLLFVVAGLVGVFVYLGGGVWLRRLITK